jgi:oxaloacetate decarboxylase alpha subunit
VEGLKPVADHFRAVAVREGRPLGQIAEYDPFHYEHQVPGGMISNLRSQLADIGLAHRLDEILEEAARVRRELGYPIGRTPLVTLIRELAARRDIVAVRLERKRTGRRHGATA